MRERLSNDPGHVVMRQNTLTRRFERFLIFFNAVSVMVYLLDAEQTGLFLESVPVNWITRLNLVFPPSPVSGAMAHVHLGPAVCTVAYLLDEQTSDLELPRVSCLKVCRVMNMIGE